MTKDEFDALKELAEKNHQAFNEIIDADLAGGARKQSTYGMIKRHLPFQAAWTRESVRKCVQITLDTQRSEVEIF